MFDSTTTTNHRQPPPPTTCFRILCHASRIGAVIGKSGSIINHIQHQTSSNIRIHIPNPTSDDRIISVSANSDLNRTMSFPTNNNNNIISTKHNHDTSSEPEVVVVVSAAHEEEVNRTTSFSSTSSNNNNNNNDGGDKISESEVVIVSAAQEALVRVFERILVVAAAEVEGGGLESLGVVSCRLLVDKSAIGSVIGKKGKVIEKIRKETGCKVRVLGKDKMAAASCALPTDEMVEGLQTRSLIGAGECRGGLYFLDMHKESRRTMMVTMDTWHKRLGHASKEKLSSVEFLKN